MATCQRCDAQLPPAAKFCVMCGDPVATPSVTSLATSTLTGSGLVIAIATGVICTLLVAGLFVLVRSLL